MKVKKAFKIIVMSYITISMSAWADVTNLVTLERENPAGKKQSVYLIGHLHLFANKIPNLNERTRRAQSAREQADIVLEWFKKIPHSLMIIEAQYPFLEKCREIVHSAEFCDCVFDKSRDQTECNNALDIMKENADRNDDTNSLEVLAERAQHVPGILVPDRRSELLHLIRLPQAILELPESFSDEDYRACLNFSAKHGPKVKDYFENVFSILNEFIESVKECMEHFTNPDNKSNAQDVLEYLQDYKELWQELQTRLQFPPSKSFPAKLIAYIKNLNDNGDYQGVYSLSRHLRLLHSNAAEFSKAFDYLLLKNIFNPQAPAKIFISTGFLHVGSVRSILVNEGFRVTYDSQIRCKQSDVSIHAFESTEGSINHCGKNIQDRQTSEVIKLLSHAMPEIHGHEEL